jgi:hypothetical protein
VSPRDAHLLISENINYINLFEKGYFGIMIMILKLGIGRLFRWLVLSLQPLKETARNKGGLEQQ